MVTLLSVFEILETKAPMTPKNRMKEMIDAKYFLNLRLN